VHAAPAQLLGRVGSIGRGRRVVLHNGTADGELEGRLVVRSIFGGVVDEGLEDAVLFYGPVSGGLFGLRNCDGRGAWEDMNQAGTLENRWKKTRRLRLCFGSTLPSIHACRR
jgi:hypothetical protein